MSAETGKAEVSHGVHYTEHSGTMATLAFGQELLFIAGSEMRVTAGLESSFMLGAENKIGIATNTHIEYGAEVKFVRGIAVELAKEGGGGYQHAFSATAGAVDPIAFTKLKTFIGFSVIPQIIAVGAMLTAIKTTFVDGTTLVPGGETGTKITIGICQNIAGVAMFLGTLILNGIMKKIHHTPLSAMTVSHASRAFLGVQGSPTSTNGVGSAGVAFEVNRFQLSASSSDRGFATHADDHEAVDFQSPGETQIVGTAANLLLRSPSLELSTNDAGSSELSRLNLGPVIVELSNIQNGNAGELIIGTQIDSAPGSPATSNMWLTSLSGGTGGLAPAKSRLALASNWARIQTTDGSMLELNSGSGATFSFAGSSASVKLSQSAAELKFGATGSVKIDAMGVEIGGSALKVLSPTAAIPNMLTKTQVKAIAFGTVTQQQLSDLKAKGTALKNLAASKVKFQIGKVKRIVENRVSVALAKTGAL